MTIADIVARYKKSKDYNVYFQTGSDDHGEKIEKKALSLNTSPQELVDKNIKLFQKLWQKLGVEYDFFYRTSSASHKEKVQRIFQQLLEKGDIYRGKYQGNYCIICEDYVKEQNCPSCHSDTKILEESAYFLNVSKYQQQLLEHYKKNPDFLVPATTKKELFANFLGEKIQDLCITRSDITWGIPVPNEPKMIIYVWFEALLNYLNSEMGEKFFFTDFAKETKDEQTKEFSCVAIQNKNNEYLLVYNKKYGEWVFPGGKIEVNESPKEAAKREIFEETNLVVENLEKVGQGIFWNDTWKAHFYQTKSYSGEVLVKEKKTIGEIKFFTINEIQQLKVSGAVKYFFEKIHDCEIIHLIGKEITRFHALYWPIILFALNKRLPNKIIAHGWLLVKGEKMSKSKGNVVDPLELLEKYPPDLLRTYFIAKINFLQDGIFSEELLKEFYQDFFIHNLGNLCQRVGKMIELYNNNIIPAFAGTENIHLKKYYQNCLSTIENYQQKMNNYQLTSAFQEIEKLLNASNKLIQELEPWNLFKNKKTELLNSTLNYLTNGIKIIVFLLTPIAPESSQIVFEYLNLKYNDFNWVNIKDFKQIAGKKIKSLKGTLFPV